ncbi:hypothetical protein U3516DRAFT_848454 [Neocallimastix sp. 'constans']
MGLICPGYNSIKSQVTRRRRKQLPPDITTLDEIPNESKYYKTKRDENFMIFKNNDLIAFQSLFQAELFSKNQHIFCGCNETENWNYYDNIEHITNNVSETFNKYLKKLSAKKKTTFFQLLSELQKEELKYYIDYERRTAGILKNKKKKKKLIRTGEIKTLVKYDKKYGNSIKKKKKKKKRKLLEMISLNWEWGISPNCVSPDCISPS